MSAACAFAIRISRVLRTGFRNLVATFSCAPARAGVSLIGTFAAVESGGSGGSAIGKSWRAPSGRQSGTGPFQFGGPSPVRKARSRRPSQPADWAVSQDDAVRVLHRAPRWSGGGEADIPVPAGDPSALAAALNRIAPNAGRAKRGGAWRAVAATSASSGITNPKSDRPAPVREGRESIS
jgi:hypothetical protein